MNKVAMVVCAAVSLALSCICLVGTANAAPAVTPRQMINYVGAVVSESEARTSNMVDTVAADERAYMKGYVDDAIDKSGGITPTVTNLVYRAVSNVVDFAIVTNIVHVSATNIVAHSLSNVLNEFQGVVGEYRVFSNYVDGVLHTVTTTVDNISSDMVDLTHKTGVSISNIMEYVTHDNVKTQVYRNDDGTFSERKITFDEDGQTEILYTTNRWVTTKEYATHLGMIVEESTIEDVPVGTMFAFVREDNEWWGELHALYNVNLANEFKYIVHEVWYDSDYKDYRSDFYTAFDESTEPIEYPKYRVYQVETLMLGHQSLYVFTNEWDGATMEGCVGRMVVAPYRLTDIEFGSVSGGKEEVGEGEDAWLETANIRLSGYKIRQEVVSINGIPQNTVVQYAGRRAPVLKANGGGNSNVPLSPVPIGVGFVSWNDVYASDLEEDERYEPDAYYPKGTFDEGRYDLWVLFPFEIVIEYEWKGHTIKEVNTIYSFDDFELFNIPYPKVPPYNGNYPKKVKNDPCKQGMHCYVNCVCTKCKTRRDHSWAIDNRHVCASCQNLNMEYDDKMIPHETSDKCDEYPCTSENEELHKGWHFVGEQDAERECVCSCETLKLNHNWGEPEGEWIEYDDTYHYKVRNCLRECGAQKKVYDQHIVEVKTPMEYRGIGDSFEHEVKGKCQLCTYEGWMLDEHDFPQYNCTCSKCNETHHEWSEWIGCGKYKNRYCTRCGEGQSDVEGLGDCHDFNPAYKISKDDGYDGTQHECHCGLKRHSHVLREGRCVGGTDNSSPSQIEGDTGCGYETDTFRRKGPFKYKSNGAISSDNAHGENDGSENTTVGGTCTGCGGSYENDVRILGYSPSTPAYWFLQSYRWAGRVMGANLGVIANEANGVMSGETNSFTTEGQWATLEIGITYDNTWEYMGQTFHNTGTKPILNYSCTFAKDKNGNLYKDWD